MRRLFVLVPILVALAASCGGGDAAGPTDCIGSDPLYGGAPDCAPADTYDELAPENVCRSYVGPNYDACLADMRGEPTPALTLPPCEDPVLRFEEDFYGAPLTCPEP